MKGFLNITFLLFLLLSLTPASAQHKIQVVATLSTYGDIAKYIGGERVEVRSIVKGNEDPHYVKPKPTFAVWLANADLFIETGLDLELWAPALIDKSGNPRIRSGQPGYVAVADGVPMLEVPAVADRSQGDVHIYGNPHVHTSPLNAKIIAENITIGLINVDPEGESYYRSNLERFKREIDERLFGKQLVQLLTGPVLTRLARNHQLFSFLESKTFQGQPLINQLGGWMKQMYPFRHRKLVAYHKNWAYFKDLFELDIIGYVEPKPGIPPSPRDVEELINQMRRQNVRVILAANYFSEQKVRKIAQKVHGIPVIVPLGVDGAPGVTNYFTLVDVWVKGLVSAFQQQAEE